MKDKTVLITGGNDGIGKTTALALAQKGATIVLACRNAEKSEKARQAIRQQTGNEQIHVLPLDLSDFHSIQGTAQSFRTRFDRLDVLVNNAGLFTSSLEKTQQGVEKQFGVNHLGHFLLTNLLLESLRAAPQPRVVNVSSNAHYNGVIDFDNLRGEKGHYKAWQAYAQSKLANVLFAKELARRNPEVISHALHPGVVATGIGHKAGWMASLFWLLIRPFQISPAKGARTSVYLASDPAVVKFENGQYFDDKQQVRRGNPLASDEDLARKLWEVSAELVRGFI